jgi:hypothetical protein
VASYDAELLKAARRLLVRKVGQRGKLPGARVRRSISTAYYALFHFLLDEVGLKLAGTGNALRVRRRVLARTIAHRGLKLAMEKVRGQALDPSISALFERDGVVPVPPPFVRELAKTFVDAQTKRHDADYDLNKPLSEVDARLLRGRIARVVRNWKNANSAEDRDFKRALCLLIVLKGQLRPEG